MSVTQRPKQAAHEIVLLGTCQRSSNRAFNDDALLAAHAVAVGFRPCLQGLVQVRMTAVFLVEYRRDVLGLPFVCAIFLPALRVTAKREHLRGRFTEQAVGSESIHHVTKNGIGDAITHETDGVIAEQLADESRGPSLSEVSQAKITAGNHQAIQFTRCGGLAQ